MLIEKLVAFIFTSPPSPPPPPLLPLVDSSWLWAFLLIFFGLLCGAIFDYLGDSRNSDDGDDGNYFTQQTKRGRTRYYKWVYHGDRRVKRRISKNEWLRRVQKA